MVIDGTTLPAIGALDAIRCERQDGESLYDTAIRVLTHEAMHRSGGIQQDAADLLSSTLRVVNYRCRQYGIRPIDAGEP